MSKHATRLIGLVVLLVLLNVVFFVETPRDIVEALGVENSYLLVFAIATLGGLNWFSSPILYTAIASFAAGGANPWLLGIAGGLGIAIGDTLIFLILRQGYRALHTLFERTVERVTTYAARVPRATQYMLSYLVLGFTPTPNDLIMAVFVVLQYKLRVVAPMLICSGITIATMTALLGGTLIDRMFG